MNDFILKVVFIIPAYNPNQKLVKYVNELIELGAQHIIVVNDGSEEKRKKYFEKLQLHKECIIINHIINQGKGRALKTGFNYYLNNFDENNYIGVVTADSDGQHTAVDSVNIAKKLADCRDKLILGTRDFKCTHVPNKSKYGNIITTQIFKLLYGIKINDTQTGLRGINNKDIRRFLLLNGEKFDFEINMLIMCATEYNKSHFVECSIQTIYEGNNNETHFRPVVDSFKIYLIMLKKFFVFGISGIISSVIDIGLFALLFSYVFEFQNIMINIFLSTIVSRLISSTLNFIFNKKIVFKSNSTLKGLIIKYWILCIIQMLTSAYLVYLIDTFITNNTTLIKICVDFILFFISYKIQNELIFNTMGNV
ncbi:MAG: glycosyltransferase [Bacilli bacterium]